MTTGPQHQALVELGRMARGHATADKIAAAGPDAAAHVLFGLAHEEKWGLWLPSTMPVATAFEAMKALPGLYRIDWSFYDPAAAPATLADLLAFVAGPIFKREHFTTCVYPLADGHGVFFLPRASTKAFLDQGQAGGLAAYEAKAPPKKKPPKKSAGK